MLEPHHVKAMYLLRSMVRRKGKSGNDIDILVEFQLVAHVDLFGLDRLQ